MTVVVDLGCWDHNGKYPSLEWLAAKYDPEMIYGFDPSPEFTLSEQVKAAAGLHRPCQLVQQAAWLYDGQIEYHSGHLSGGGNNLGVAARRLGAGPTVMGRLGVVGEGSESVPCFDFSEWLGEHGPAVVKMDIEGAEYGLLERLVDDGRTHLITELLIEWHAAVPHELLKHCQFPAYEWVM